MEKAAAAPERAVIQPQEPEAPTGWAEAQESLAAATGLAILLVEGHQPPALVVSNNNSICQAFQSSPIHAHLCEPFCGQAHKRALKAGSGESASCDSYRCHAGLQCFAVPLKFENRDVKPLAVIIGRAFLRSSDYRALAERIRTGEFSELLSEDLFRNVIFASEQDLVELRERISEAAQSLTRIKRAPIKSIKEGGGGKPITPPVDERAADARSSSPPKENLSLSNTLNEACSRAVPVLVETHGIESLALMLREQETFVSYCATGKFVQTPPRLTLKAREIKQLQSATRGESITIPASGRASSSWQEMIELFPLVVGQEIKGALIVGDSQLSDVQRRAIANFCRDMAMPFEVLRLREELERRMRAATHLQAFTEHINSAGPDEAYATILRHSTDLLHAERGSLLLFDEGANELAVKAAVGPRAEIARETRMRLGDGVSGTVLSEGRPLVVRDIGSTGGGHHPAPAERSYKTGSFISYPITIAGRKVGVLNVTDKAGGGFYDEVDLGLLEMMAPQMALALDRAEWHQKATQFQLLSITDPLTGLLNRRYLEERLSEELERSKRHRYPMSFMMVDIDDFKNYNDRHGHQAGDLALEMTAQCLKSALRSADVASRYGGEEFSILLPQTNLSEAHVIAERIRRRVERTHYPHGKTQPLGAVTVSIGISAFGPEADTSASIIFAADQALYVAKSRGKNCVDSFASSNPENGSSASDAERDIK